MHFQQLVPFIIGKQNILSVFFHIYFKLQSNCDIKQSGKCKHTHAHMCAHAHTQSIYNKLSILGYGY